MFVHRCNRCCVYLKEIYPCSPKYRGIWAICMNKMMFPSESCNSVSKGTFREFRPFSLSRTFSPHVPPEPLCVPQFGNRGSRLHIYRISLQSNTPKDFLTKDLNTSPPLSP